MVGEVDTASRTLAPPVLLAATAAAQHLERAAQAELRTRAEHGVVEARRRTLDHVHALLDRVAGGEVVGPVDAAVLAVGLADVQARDAVATLILTREDELLSLLVQVARRVVPPDDAEALATALQTLAGDAGLRTALSARAAAVGRERFDAAANYGRLLQTVTRAGA